MRCLKSIRLLCAQLLLVTAACVTAMSASTAQATEEFPPVIEYFSWYNPMGNYFVFYGTVSHEAPYGCVVLFNGLLENFHASVGYDGYFFLVVELPEGTIGDVNALAVSNDGQTSEVAGTFVFF